MKIREINTKIKERLEKRLIELAIDMRYSQIETKSNSVLGYYSTFMKDKLEDSKRYSNKIILAYKRFFKKNSKFRHYAFFGNLFSIPNSEIDSLYTFGRAPESEDYIHEKDWIYKKYRESILVKKAKEKLNKKLKSQRFLLDHIN